MSSAPSLKDDYVNHLLGLLELDVVKSHPSLVQLLEKQAEILIEQTSPLTPEQQNQYQWSDKIIVGGKVSSFVMKKLLKEHESDSVSSPPSFEVAVMDSQPIAQQPIAQLSPHQPCHQVERKNITDNNGRVNDLYVSPIHVCFDSSSMLRSSASSTYSSKSTSCVSPNGHAKRQKQSPQVGLDSASLLLPSFHTKTLANLPFDSSTVFLNNSSFSPPSSSSSSPLSSSSPFSSSSSSLTSTNFTSTFESITPRTTTTWTPPHPVCSPNMPFPFVSSARPPPSETRNINSRSSAADVNIDSNVLFEQWKFGADKWREYFGDVGNEPPLPPQILQIFNRPCPIWPDKKVYQTHVLVLIPQAVNARFLDLAYMQDLALSAWKGNRCKYSKWRVGLFDEPATPYSHWVVLTRDVLPNSCGMSFERQTKMLEQYDGVLGKWNYHVPRILDVVTAIMVTYVASGVKIYSIRPPRYTRCCEFYEREKGTYLAVGKFDSTGLHIHCDDWMFETIGMGGSLQSLEA